MMNKAIILSLAATAMAAPRYHPSGSGMPFPAGNSTGIWGTGTGTGKACSLVSKTAGAPTTTSTSVVYETTDVTSVLTVTGVKAQGTGAPGAGGNGGNGGVCSSRSTVTVKTTEKVYITVTPGASTGAGAATSNGPVAYSSAPVAAEKPSSVSFVLASPSAAAAPSPSAAAQQPSSAPANTPSSTPSPISAAQPSQYAAPSSAAAPAPSSYVAPIPIPVPSTKPSSSAAAPVSSTPATGGSYGSGKRGLAYNDASLTKCFAGDTSKISWGYNWGSSRSGLPDNYDFAPMLWGTRSDFTSVWEKNVADAISKGSKNILGFNEPDHTEQANMSPAAAVTAWKQYLEPVKAKNSGVRLGSPAVTNGANGMGLDWLSSFLSQCSGCNVDFVAIHWYDSCKNVEYFKQHVKDAHDKSGGKPVWITEFGATGSDADIATFLGEVLPWLDSQSFVERYAYFMVKDGFLNAGTEKSTIGSAYASA